MGGMNSNSGKNLPTPCDEFTVLRTSVRELMRDLATLPQGNQAPLVVKDQVGRAPAELGMGKTVECDSFRALALFIGRQEGHPARKMLGMNCAHLTELQLSPPPPSPVALNKIQNGDILVPV